MIVRILGEGQYEVESPRALDQLNTLDVTLECAVGDRDAAAFATALDGLLAAVRRLGHPVAQDRLTASDFVLPAAEASLEQVRGLLREDGLPD